MKQVKAISISWFLIGALAVGGLGYWAGSQSGKADEDIGNNEALIQKEAALTEAEAKLDELTLENQELVAQLETLQEQNNHFPFVSNLALAFVRAQTSGDLEGLKALVSDQITLEESDGQIIASYESGGYEVEILLYSEDSLVQYQDMVIQGFGANEKGNLMVHIREFYVDAQGESLSPPTFVNLEFKQEGTEWKIVSISFDV